MEKNLDRLVDDREELLERIVTKYSMLGETNKANLGSLADVLIAGQHVHLEA